MNYLRLDGLCKTLGLDVSAQRKRISDDDAISDLYIIVPVETPYQDSHRIKDVGFIDIQALVYWLGGIDAKRVRDELRDKIILYKRDFVYATYQLYRSEFFSAELRAEIDTRASTSEREFSELMASVRENQNKLNALSGRLEEELVRVGMRIEDLSGKLSVVEAQVLTETPINYQRREMLSKMIKFYGDALWRNNKSNYSQSQAHAYAMDDFKNFFAIDIYTALPYVRFGDAIEFLKKRWQFLNPGKPVPQIFADGSQQSLL